MKNRTRDKIKAPKWSFNWDLTIRSVELELIYIGWDFLFYFQMHFLSFLHTVPQWVKIKYEVTSHIYKYLVQEIKSCGLRSRIGDMEAKKDITDTLMNV